MAGPESINVFVYGTLLFREVTDSLGIMSNDPYTGTPIPLIRRAAVLDGFERFTVQLRPRGNFPAIIRGEGSVRGDLLKRVTPDSLQRLDYFEGIADGYYQREIVRLQCEGDSIDAFAYVCGDPLRQHLDGPWDADVFRDRDLSWYISEVVDPF